MSELYTGVALVAAVGFLLGYALGRRQGEKEGFLQGVHYAPLEMRRAALEKGRCIICGRSAQPRQPPDPSPEPADGAPPAAGEKSEAGE